MRRYHYSHLTEVQSEVRRGCLPKVTRYKRLKEFFEIPGPWFLPDIRSLPSLALKPCLFYEENKAWQVGETFARLCCSF